MRIRNKGAYRRLVVSLTAAALIIPMMPPAAKAASTSFIIDGGGWGHGLGLGQYGTKGQADAGRSYSQILKHYYSNTAVGARSMPSSVRVGVLWNRSEISFTGDGLFNIRSGSPTGSIIASGASGEVWRVRTNSSGSFILVKPNGSTHSTQPTSSSVFVTYAGASTLLKLPQTGLRYKYGYLEINTYKPSSTWLTRAIVGGNTMQQYLYGLGEVPSSWPAEALKAQAVAGRTYAAEKISRLGQSRSTCNCGMYASTVDQAYVGYEKEAGSYGSAWKAAVDATNNVAVTYGDPPKLIEAYYSSSTGGYTEHNENVWGGTPRSYLRGVPDPWDSVSPLHSWTKTYSLSEMQNILNSRSDTAVGTLINVEVVPPLGVSGRVLSVLSSSTGGIRITGTGGTKRVSGDRFRIILGLRSTLFRIVRTGVHPNGTLLKGTGAAVYRLVEGRLRPFVSMPALKTWADPSQIIKVTDAALLQYSGANARFRDGTLIRTEDGTIWIVSNARKRGFTSAQVFLDLGFDSANAIDVTDEEAALQEDGTPITSSTTHPDGSLLKADGDTIYWKVAGAKRPIPSISVFSSWFDSSETVVVDQATLDGYPIGSLLGHRDGSLIKTTDGTIWISTDGKRRGFTNAGAFVGLGYSWANVIPITNSEASALPVASNITSASIPHPNGTVMRGSIPDRFVKQSGVRRYVSSERVFESWNYASSDVVGVPDAKLVGYPNGNSAMGYRDGSLIKTPDGTVWMVSDGKRRGFTSAAVFKGLGFSFNNVFPVSWGEAGAHSVGPKISSAATHPNGSLIKSSGATVWWIQDGRRRPLPSMSVFNSWRFRSADIVTIANSKATSYPSGSVLGFNDGTLIKTPDGTVWIVSDGKRRGFTSGSVFTRLGYSFKNVIAVSSSLAALHPAGDPIR